MDSLLGALASQSLVSSAPSPARPSQPQPKTARPVSVIPHADAAFRTAADGDRRRVEFALTEGRWAGRRSSAPAHKISVIGQPCALQQPAVGSIEVPGYNDAGVQTECLLDGRVSRRRCHRSAWAAARGRSQRNVRRFPAALSWVWMEPIIPIGNGRAQLPEVWQGDGPNEEAKWKQNVTRRAAGRLVERLASIPAQALQGRQREREGEGREGREV